MTTLVRWDPFRELAALQSDMSRLMGSALSGEGAVRSGRSWIPAVDVWETDADVVYAFDLPGIPEDDISVEFEEGTLTVTAERERKHEVRQDGFARYERHFGTFSRTIALPQGVDEDGVTADYENGVLEVHVRKPEQTKPRRIQIGSSEKATIEGATVA